MIEMAGVFLVFSICCAAGAVAYRARGAEWADWPRPIKQALYSAMPAVMVYNVTADWTLEVAALVLLTGATCLGQCAYMDLGTTPDPEHLDERPVGWVLRPFARAVGITPGGRAYDTIGLTLNGLLMALAIAVPLMWAGEWAAGLVALVAGPAKTAAYAIGWFTPLRRFGATDVGEWLTGAFQYAVFLVALVVGVLS